MKRLVIFVIVLLVCSCNKETSDSLEYCAFGGYNAENVYRLVSFKPNNKAEDFLYVSVDGTPIKYELSYTHTGNKVSLVEATGTYATGTISGNTIIMDYGYDGGIWTLIKR